MPGTPRPISFRLILCLGILHLPACSQPDERMGEPIAPTGKVDAASPGQDREGAAQEAQEPPPPAPIMSDIPPRPPKAMSGSAFIKRTAGLSIMAREDRILDEVMRGNIPDFLRHFVAIRLVKQNPEGVVHRGWAWVTPDYLAVGSDEDFVRMPMDPVTAQRVADRYGCLMVTPALVDATYRQAALKLKPIPMKPGRQMRSNRYYARHQRLIEAHLQKADHGLLIAGHKKDVVLTNRLVHHPKRVAIYGWHEDAWTPIQPLSVWHRKTYADYSHGVRLLYKEMILDGRQRHVEDVLRDPELAWVLSDEGPLEQTRITPDGLEWGKDERQPAEP